MKIIHLSTYDVVGGAGRAAYRLHKGLQRAGHESVMVVSSRTTEDPSVVEFEPPMAWHCRIGRSVRRRKIEGDFMRYGQTRPSGYELFSDDRAPLGRKLLESLPACQIINLHWVSHFVDYEAFLTRIPRQTATVWTLHDLNPMTGGCHYDLGCGRYVCGCGACPQLGSRNPNDLSEKIWQRKRRLFGNINPPMLHIVAPSRWMANEVKRSPLFGRFTVDTIPHGLDLEAFAPRHRESARRLLGIPQDARVLLFAAENVSNRRKGFSSLLEALARCTGTIPNLLLLSLGQNRPDVPLSIPSMHIELVSHERFLSMVYSAADLFVTCPQQEAFGLTVLEAMACGVPVVGYGVGGILDMVREGLNGSSVAPNDPEGLAFSITRLLNDQARCSEMGANARRIASAEYSLEQQAQRYSELYSTLV